MKISILISLFTLVLGTQALASSKICFGSTKDDQTKGVVMTAEISNSSVTLKTVKDDDGYNGTYPALGTNVKGHDGKTYAEFKGEFTDYQDIIMVDQALFQNGSTGLLQIRARGEGFFNSVFVCRDAR